MLAAAGSGPSERVYRQAGVAAPGSGWEMRGVVHPGSVHYTALHPAAVSCIWQVVWQTAGMPGIYGRYT